MSGSRILEQILQLDPKADHQRIVRLIACHEFPCDMMHSLQFALFRTLCSPSISGLLSNTGELRQRAQRRYHDTALLLGKLVTLGYDSEHGCTALRQMNRIHRRFPIANDDYLYVLSALVYEPIGWNTRFGWRPMSEHERLAIFCFWFAVGRRMGIRLIPPTYDGFEQYKAEYERDRFRYCETTRRLGEATCGIFAQWFLPPFLHPLGAPAIYALMDEPMLHAFGLPRPSDSLRFVVEAVLKAYSRPAAARESGET